MTAPDLSPAPEGPPLKVPQANVPLVARAFRSLLSGDPNGTPPWVARIATGDADCLVEPEGPSWVVHGLLSTLVGGVRALMMQALQPGAVTGVAEHSAYRTDTIGRLRRTTQWLVITTFADVADRAGDGRRRAEHARAGRRHRPRRPALLRVRPRPAALGARRVHGPPFLTAHLALGSREIPAVPTRTWPSGAASAELLGATELPQTQAELRAQLDVYRADPGFGRAPATEDVAAFLRALNLPTAYRAPYRVLALAAAATSDPADAALLGLPQRAGAVARLPAA